MAKKISHRCGVCGCEFRCPIREHDSGCSKYTDRRKCERSMSNRMSVAAKYRKRVKQIGGGKMLDLLNW